MVNAPRRRSHSNRAILLAAVLICSPLTANAVDSEGTTPLPPLTLAPGGTPTTAKTLNPAAATFADRMRLGRAAIDASDWTTAIAEFSQAVVLDPRSADAFNLLAFSQRKAGRLDDAFANYKKALAIDPKHLGANEYLGEAYLQTKNVTLAKKQLATLKKLCSTTCEEYKDLASEIAAYEKAAKTATATTKKR